ncbi:TetR/AcrR family transcriptional regulator [Streptomyces galilaeus]|uniref:TetR/AcrR family transcriptional regulator n=1 Tax=Streptomyces galilaeus TaxID=33899 RepID=UPI0038F79F48
MPLKYPELVRERLLDAATDILWCEGLAVSVQEICQSAGISKRTMYQIFTSKDELLAASVERQAQAWHREFVTQSWDAYTPRECILDIFARIERADRRGGRCGFATFFAVINALGADHPAAAAARRAIERLRDFFHRRAREAGVSQAEPLVDQLMLIFSGASAHARIPEAPGEKTVATHLARMVLDSAGLH